MSLLRLIFPQILSGFERPIDRLKEIRDSYRALNIEIYGEEVANLLNDW